MYHRPLSTYLNSVIQAGCMLQKVIEPQLEKAVAELHNAERYWLVPGYLVIFATRVAPLKEARSGKEGFSQIA
jgi:hypothetical protein